nr:MAG TPA: hypothetical protein [Caudoviricetes sp.]
MSKAKRPKLIPSGRSTTMVRFLLIKTSLILVFIFFSFIAFPH